AAPAAPSISVADASASLASAAAGAVTFKVTLSAPSTKSITVAYSTADGTATAASGAYKATSGTLTFAAGQTSQSVAVTVAGFATAGLPSKTFLLKLSNAVNGTLARASGTATIVD